MSAPVRSAPAGPLTAAARDAFQRALRRIVRGEIYFDEMSRGLYATDASHYQIAPVAVAVPKDEFDVAAAVRVAAEHGVSILLRAGGTSLAGQTVGASLVLDCSKYMKRVLQINVKERWVRVEPGMVRDNLNHALRNTGFHFAPDPATTDRAGVGGMIGNNSSGMRSIVYGKTVDHVLGVRVLLATGEILDLAELSPEDYARRAAGQGREAEIYRGFRALIETHRDEIARRFPRVMRRVSGYNLDEFIRADRWNLAKLITGSEGTLAVLLEARLKLEPLPSGTALCVVHFADLLEAVRATPVMLEHGPSAVELVDARVLELARRNPGSAALCDFLVGEPAAIQIVEFFGADGADAPGRAQGFAAEMRRRGLGYAHVLRTEAAEKARVWEVRKSGLGLTQGQRGTRRPAHFMEDSAVPVEVLGDYVERVLAVCRRRGVEATMYGHASVGVVHVQPILDLKRPEEVDQMRAIAREAMALVREYGGSLSGEHGDGLVRSAFLEDFFGPQLTAAFAEVKRLFDPAGLMNPGKIVGAPPIGQNLRYPDGYAAPAVATEYHHRADGGFLPAIEMCTGVGACRRTLAGVMCPSYRVTMDEEHSTRGRANALRLALTGQLGPDGLTGARLHEVLDLCLSCKACKTECPSNVDLARLKGEYLQLYHDRRGATRRERMVADSPRMAARLAGPLAPLVNGLQATALVRRGLEAALDLDRRRTLPAYTSEPFARWFRRHRPAEGAGTRGKVVLFDDTYLNYYEPRVGRAAVELLESCGYEVLLARAGCCQRPRISHGFLREAKRDGEQTLRRLDRYIAEGCDIVVCEPGCASALTDDLPDLIADEALGERIRAHVMMIDVFLARELLGQDAPPRFTSPFGELHLHGHCHQKSLYGTAAMMALWARVPGLAVKEIEAGCCGMAGSFGYEREHYELSLRIGEDRLFPAVRTLPEGARVVACGFSCRHQLAHATGIEALHWVETLRGAGAEP